MKTTYLFLLLTFSLQAQGQTTPTQVKDSTRFASESSSNPINNSVSRWLLNANFGGQYAFWSKEIEDDFYNYETYLSGFGMDLNLDLAYNFKKPYIHSIGTTIGFSNNTHHLEDVFMQSYLNADSNWASNKVTVIHPINVKRYSIGQFVTFEKSLIGNFGGQIGFGVNLIYGEMTLPKTPQYNYTNLVLQPRFNFEYFYYLNRLRFSLGLQLRLEAIIKHLSFKQGTPNGIWGDPLFIQIYPKIGIGWGFGKVK